MSTQTPTSDPFAALTDSLPGVAGLVPALPSQSQFVDIAKLGDLANAFFRSLPGDDVPVPHDPVLDLGTGGTPVLEPDLRIAATTPQPQGTGAPVSEVPTPHATSLASPLGYSASLPQVGGTDPRNSVPGAAVPSTPYYFLSHATELPSSPAGVQPVPLENLVTPQSQHFPGQAEVSELLKEIASGGRQSGQLQPTVPGQGFYFVDRSAAPAELAPSDKPAYQEVAPSAHPQFDVNAVRRDFPILQERVNGHQLAWFDNGATTQKPNQVIDRISHFYKHENSNIHRAAHELAARSTDAYEGARDKVAKFLGAQSKDEIIFVRGATEGINLIANTFGKQFIGEGDEIVVSLLEHHANIVPWQMLARSVGAKIRVIPVDDTGQIILDEYQKLINDRTKLVAVTQVSNALGTVTPITEIIEIAHRRGAKVLVDGAQSVAHLRANVQAVDADFFVFSGHKVFGPTGIGAVYGKLDLLNQLPPWQGGGNMISDVTFDRTLYHDAPTRFEAGTGYIADAVGLGAALDYVQRLGIENIAKYEHDLLGYATQELLRVPGLKLIGTAKEKASVLSLTLAGYSNQEVGVALNREGIAVRTGHHCAQPILRRFGLESTVRPTLALYNTCEEVDRLVAGLKRIARGQSEIRGR
jgi:cysteine desulfurase/selenocysteine lyase